MGWSKVGAAPWVATPSSTPVMQRKRHLQPLPGKHIIIIVIIIIWRNDNWIFVSNFIRDWVPSSHDQHDSAAYHQVGDELAALPAAVATASCCYQHHHKTCRRNTTGMNCVNASKPPCGPFYNKILFLPLSREEVCPLAFSHFRNKRKGFKNDDKMMATAPYCHHHHHHEQRRVHSCSWKKIGETAFLAATVSAFISMGVKLLLKTAVDLATAAKGRHMWKWRYLLQRDRL